MENFESHYFSGQGPVFLGPYSQGDDGLEFIGDVSQVEFPPNVSRTDVKENVSGNRLIAASFRNTTEYPLTIQMKSVKPAHMARAIGATATAKAAGSVSDEAHTAHQNKFIRLAHVKVSSVVVTDNVPNPAFVAGTDYVLYADEGMIEILNTGSITEDMSLLIDYDYAAQSHLTVNSNDEDLILVCPAINRANSDKRGRLRLHKINLDPGAISVIIDGDNEGTASITGRVLVDTTRAASDQVYGWEMEA